MDWYNTYHTSNQNICLSGIVSIGTNVGGLNTLGNRNISITNNLVDDNDYSDFKKHSLKILKNYLDKKPIKEKEKCIEIIQGFHDDLIHVVIVFLNNKKRKKSLLKYLTQVRKTILDTPTYVY